MSFLELTATLTGEPFLMGFDAIGRLTPFQVQRVLSHPRDKEGRIRVGHYHRVPDAKPVSERDAHDRLYSIELGLPKHRVDELWNVRHELAKAKAELWTRQYEKHDNMSTTLKSAEEIAREFMPRREQL